jgi:hypothetical protein
MLAGFLLRPRICSAAEFFEIDAPLYSYAALSAMPKGLNLSDTICVKRNAISIACGKMFKITQNSVFVKIIKVIPIAKVKPGKMPPLVRAVGDHVKESTNISITFLGRNNLVSRAIVNTGPTKVLERKSISNVENRRPKHSESSSFSVGLDYLFPIMRYQYATGLKSSLGVTVLLLTYSVNPTYQMGGLGSFLSLNHYDQSIFKGFWIELGAGGYFLNENINPIPGETFSLAVLAHLGWRWRWGGGPGFGFAAGAQYISRRQNSLLLPSIVADISFVF